MSNDLAQADTPTNLTSEETSLVEAPASVPATSPQDDIQDGAATQPVGLDVEALDEAGYYQQISNLDNLLAQQPDAQPEEVPALEEQTADETQTQTENDTNEESEAEPTSLDESTLPERVRIGNWSEQERKAILLRQRNPDMTLAEAMDRVSLKSDPNAEESQEPTLPSIDEVQGKIAELKAQKKEALANVELDKIFDIDEQLEAARESIANIKLAHERASIEEGKRFESQVEVSKARAISQYPDVTKPDSPFVKKMFEIDNRLRDTNNPLFYSADKLERVAQMAGNELGIPPADPKQKPSSPKANTQAQRVVTNPSSNRPTTPMIAPANARTSRPSQEVINGSFDDLLNSATDMDQLIAIAAKLGK